MTTTLRGKSTKYCAWVKKECCVLCGMPGDDPHHLPTTLEEQKMGFHTRRSRDILGIVALCRRCHTVVHAKPSLEKVVMPRLRQKAREHWATYCNTRGKDAIKRI